MGNMAEICLGMWSLFNTLHAISERAFPGMGAMVHHRRLNIGVDLKAVASGQSAEGNVFAYAVAFVKSKVKEVIIELMALLRGWCRFVDDLVLLSQNRTEQFPLLQVLPSTV